MKKVSIETVEHYGWGDRCDGWHLVQSTQLSVIQERMPPGAEEVSHFHERAEQFFYVFSGTANMIAAGQEYKLRAGEGFHVPAGTVHRIRNDSDQVLDFMVTSTPPSHGDRTDVSE